MTDTIESRLSHQRYSLLSWFKADNVRHCIVVAKRGAQVRGFTTFDGVEIAYFDEGNAKLGTLVFVHGGPGFNSSYFRPFASRLTSDFRTVLYDQRGSCLSGRNVPDSSITMVQFVRDLHELLEHLDVKPVILLGQSFGGAVALEFTLAHPRQVKKVILENGFADARISLEDRLNGAARLAQAKDIPHIAQVVRKYKRDESLTLDEFDHLCGKDVQELYRYDPYTDVPFEGGLERWWYSKATVDVVRWIVESFWNQGLFTSYSILDELPRLHQPVLVMTGRHDCVISPRHAWEVARRLKRSRLEILEQSGHYPHEEEPEAFRKLLIDFATEASRPGQHRL